MVYNLGMKSEAETKCGRCGGRLRPVVVNFSSVVGWHQAETLSCDTRFCGGNVLEGEIYRRAAYREYLYGRGERRGPRGFCGV